MSASTLPVRAAGVLLHVTSLPGPHGSGDFGPAAYRFVDWLAAAGQRVWQILPLQPPGPGDSPYQSVSAFAGSPWLVALEPLVEAGWLQPTAPPRFDGARVDHAAVVPWRVARLREAAAGFGLRASAHDRAAFARWCSAEAHWLDDYALFMALAATHDDRPWWQWPDALARRDANALADARAKDAAEIGFWRFVQWCFDTQWRALRVHARKRGVAVFGDLPIFVAHHSADCWARPDLYFLDAHLQPTVVAGVPPDFFSSTGQRWGNPLYHWDRMAADGQRWWIARVARALAQVDLFRIDHFRGFAAYWEIPAASPTAIDGRWVRGPGKALFDTLEAALGALPIVAEDLGIITPDVEALRDDCGFPGMRVLQFAFGETANHLFLPHRYVTNSVVYTGTHDNDTTEGWWQSAGERERAFVQAYLGPGNEAMSRRLIRVACQSLARLAMYPLQDVLGLDSRHRMNTPGSMSRANWSWRVEAAALDATSARWLGRLAAATDRAPFDVLQDESE
ncbi:MAG: 4-alpha-glucanotransferase [Burkholderiaceae bacterium]